MFVRALSFAAVFHLGAGAASAQAVDCDNAITQFDMNQCAYESYMQADAVLNVTWKRAMAAMKSLDAILEVEKDGAADALLAAQRSWITYRDQACEAEGWLYHGGSMRPLIVATCLEDLTKARTERLKYLIEVN